MLSKMKLGTMMTRGKWCRDAPLRTFSNGASPWIVIPSRRVLAMTPPPPPPPPRFFSNFVVSSRHGRLRRTTDQPTRRFFSVGVSLRDAATLADYSVVVDDPLLRNAAVPENFAPQRNILEEVTNAPEDSAIEILEFAIDEVLRTEKVAMDRPETVVEFDDDAAIDAAPVEIDGGVGREAPADLNAPVEIDDGGFAAEAPAEVSMAAIDDTRVVEPTVADPSMGETTHITDGLVSTSTEITTSASMEALAEPVNILSSAAVDPSLIPLPPLPPIAIPTSRMDLPFADLGLNSWWPPGWVQWGLEYSHVGFGLPWWSSVLLTAVVVRIATIPLFIYSQRMVANNSKLSPDFLKLQMKYNEASLSGDWIKKMRAQNDMASFMKTTGYKPFSAMKPALFQMPIFLSVFVAIRGMVNVPVESMKHEGLWWFTNLTAADPYYLLPLFNSLSLWLQMELGVEMMAASKLENKQKWVMRAIPLVMFPIVCFQSSAVLIYWSVSIWLAFGLKAGLRWEPAAKYFNVPKVEIAGFKSLISDKKTTEPFSFKGKMKSAKKTYNKFKAGKLATSVEKKDETRWREAGIQGAVKTYKYDPTKVRDPRLN